MDHDNATTKFARFISSTFGAMPINEALGEIVCLSNYSYTRLDSHVLLPTKEMVNVLGTMFETCWSCPLQKNNPSKWKQKITEGMAMDFSWEGECCDIHVSAYASIKNL